MTGGGLLIILLILGILAFIVSQVIPLLYPTRVEVADPLALAGAAPVALFADDRVQWRAALHADGTVRFQGKEEHPAATLLGAGDEPVLCWGEPLGGDVLALGKSGRVALAKVGFRTEFVENVAKAVPRDVVPVVTELGPVGNPAGCVGRVTGRDAFTVAVADSDGNVRIVQRSVKTNDFTGETTEVRVERTLQVEGPVGLLAIDREQITDTLFHGTRTPATDWTSPVLGKDGGYRAGLCGEFCEYDPDDAKKLIREGGGLPGGKVTITYNADTGSHRAWVDAVCNSINNALDDERACVAEPVGTFADYRNRITGREMSGPFRAGWQMDYPLIQNFLQPLYYTGASSNDGKWSDERFDDLVDRANRETDPAKAVGLFQQAEEVVRDDMAAIPLWYQNGSAGWSERLSDVRLNPFSVPVYDQIKVS